MSDTIPINNMFNDPRWSQIAMRLWHNEDLKKGSVLATWNPRFNNYALNQRELERLIAGKRDRKVDKVTVVAARRNDTGRYEVFGEVDAETLYEKLRDRPTIAGAFGPFWALDPYELGDKEAPF